MTTNDLIWNLVVVIGCGIAVFGYGASGWWFLLALMLIRT